MRKRLSPLIALPVASLLLLTGCGDSTQHSAYDKAMDALAVADRGYVTPARGEDEPADSLEHRQLALAEAGKALDEVIAHGSPVQKASAYRLRAEVDASAARYAAHLAATHYGRIAPQAVELISHALAASRAGAGSADRGTGQAPLLTTFNQTQGQLQQRQAELAQQVGELEAQLKAVQAQKDEIEQRRDAAAAEAAALRNQAFIASGEEQFRIQDEAAARDRDGTLAAAEAARRQLDIDLLSSRLKVARSQAALAERLLANVQERTQQVRQTQAQIEQDAAAAAASRRDELTELTAAYAQTWDAFKNEVDARLDEAAAQTALAVQRLQQAGSVEGAPAPGLQADLLAALTTRAELLAEHAQTLAGFEEILALAAQLAEDDEAPLRAWIAELQRKRAAVSQLAMETIEQGRQAASRSTSGPDMNLAQQRAQLLEVYAQQLQRLPAAG